MKVRTHWLFLGWSIFGVIGSQACWGLIWDPDLDIHGTTLETASPAPGQRYWELIEATAEPEDESGGKINIFYRTKNLSGNFEAGVWVRTEWSSGYSDSQTKSPPDTEWGDFPMAGGNWCPPDPPGPYSTRVIGRDPGSPDLSDRVVGMGLPCNEHWSYHLIFEEKIAAAASTPTPTTPPGATPTPTSPGVVTPTPTSFAPTGPPRWKLSYARQIGYYQNHNPIGNHVIENHTHYENGTHASGIGLTNDYNSGTAIFGYTDTYGHNRIPLNPPNNPYDIHVYDPPIASDRSPDLHWYVPPLGYSGHYSFELHFVKVTHDDEVTTFPFTPVYHYDLCDGFNDEFLNHPAGFESDETVLTSWATYQCQTFIVPEGINRIIEAKAGVTRGYPGGVPALVTWKASIRQGGPDGTQIGPWATAREIFPDEFFPVLVSWDIQDVPVVPGSTYCLRVEATDAGGFNAYGTVNDNYPDGQMYNNSSPVPGRDMLAVVVGCHVGGGGPGTTPTPTSWLPSPTPTETPGIGENWDFELWNTDKDAVAWIEIDTDHIDRGQSEIAYGDNPLVPGSPENVRVGAGWHVYDCALVQQISVVPDTQYRLRAYGRVLHGTDTINMWTGVNFDNQVMEMGYDLSGQTSNQNAGTVVYTDMTTSGNNVWAMYQTTFVASGPTVSIWAHASQPTAEVGLCHFDDFSVQAISQPATSTPTATEPPPVPTATPTITVTPIEPQTGLDDRWKAY